MSRQSQAGVSAALRLRPPLPTTVLENVSPPTRAAGQLHQSRLETLEKNAFLGLSSGNSDLQGQG